MPPPPHSTQKVMTHEVMTFFLHSLTPLNPQHRGEQYKEVQKYIIFLHTALSRLKNLKYCICVRTAKI